MYQLINNVFPTSVGINTFITTMFLALTTTCDGGALLTTQGTHICLILSFILRGSRVAFISPNICLNTCLQKCTAYKLRLPLSLRSGCLTPSFKTLVVESVTFCVDVGKMWHIKIHVVF